MISQLDEGVLKEVEGTRVRVANGETLQCKRMCENREIFCGIFRS